MNDSSDVENDKEVASETVVSEAVPDRRRLFRKLVTLAGLGITGALLSQDKIGLLPEAHGADNGPMLIGNTNVSDHGMETAVQSSGSDALAGYNLGSGSGVSGIAGGSGDGVLGQSNSGIGVHGSGVTGVQGETTIELGYGVKGVNTGGGTGVYGETNGAGAGAVTGHATSSTGANAGVSASTESNGGYGVYASANATSGNSVGVYGQSNSGGGFGVQGFAAASGGVALWGLAGSPGAKAIVAQGASGQTANLQEWWSNSQALSVVDKNGRFGIGTTSPSDPLTIVSSSGTLVGLRINSSINESTFSFNNTATGGREYMLFSTGGTSGLGQGKFAIYDRTANQTRLAVDSSGKVGIGTSSPSHLIQLSGGAYSDGSTWNNASSVRWKDNIEPLTGGVETLKQLHPVAYNYKKTPAKRTMGFIAEEVGKVLPTVADWDKAEEGFAEGYDHVAILALAVQSIREQQSQIDAMRSEIMELKRARTS